MESFFPVATPIATQHTCINDHKRKTIEMNDW